MAEDQQQDEEWRVQPGEPALKVVVATLPNGEKRVGFAAQHPSGMAFSLVFRPAVAEWVSGELAAKAALARSGIIIPTPRDNGGGIGATS